MATVFLGSLILVPFNFAPKGFALCNGQTLPINQNQALFALLGTVYGGNGQTTFALPNLQGRVAVHTGSGFTLGQTGGSESVALTTSEIPAHIHNLVFSGLSGGTATSPAGAWPGVTTPPNLPYSSSAGSTMAAGMIANSGGSGPHENRQPFLVLNWAIALQGIFPPRS